LEDIIKKRQRGMDAAKELGLNLLDHSLVADLGESVEGIEQFNGKRVLILKDKQPQHF
jgi:hypothetical protein